MFAKVLYSKETTKYILTTYNSKEVKSILYTKSEKWLNITIIIITIVIIL